LVSESVLVAGIGNIFLSDDGFGVEVANRFCGRDLPSCVRAEDFGIRGVHLAYELLDGYRALVLIDAVDLRDAPGTLTVMEPELGAAWSYGDVDAAPVMDAHSMSPEVVLGTLARLGGSVEQIFVVGCQPATLDEGIGLSPAVANAIDPAVELCSQLVAEILRPERKEARA
jgi:hydrogenase maturation protease